MTTPKPPKGKRPACKRDVAVVRDGVLSNHGASGKRCPGSGNPAAAREKE